MGPIGVQEMIFIFILALLLFGPKKLPELARLLGKGLSEFRRAKNELQSTFQTHMQELERETRMDEAKKSAASSAMITPPANPYSYAADEYGQASAGYGYSSSDGSSYPAEPPVEAHAAQTHEIEGPAPTPPLLEPVTGSVPRTNGVQSLSASAHSADTHSSEAKEEHPA
jgi:TatA/E family protein of Tat protein translocase